MSNLSEKKLPFLTKNHHRFKFQIHNALPAVDAAMAEENASADFDAAFSASALVLGIPLHDACER